MGGDTIERIKQIGHDLASSWYFRVWAFIWLILALTAFSGLIILSKESEKAKAREDIRMWMNSETLITFPRFHFRLDQRGDEIFQDWRCTFGNTSIQLNTYDCQSFRTQSQPFNQCIAFGADQFSAADDIYPDTRISCTLVTSGLGYQNNTMMSFGLEGEHQLSFGGQAFHSLWFAPNDNAWILLEKSTFQTSSSGSQQNMWRQTLAYHSTVYQPNFYNVSVLMGSFIVTHFQPTDTFNGWMAIGDIGGVAYFMVLLHTLVMIVVGVFLSNSSSFLAWTPKEN